MVRDILEALKAGWDAFGITGSAIFAIAFGLYVAIGKILQSRVVPTYKSKIIPRSSFSSKTNPIENRPKELIKGEGFTMTKSD